MWKWTDPDNIKVIILDTDSLDKEYLVFPYNQYINDIQLFFVKHGNSLNGSKEQDVITYSDITYLLQEVLRKSVLESPSVIAISDNPIFLKEMMQNHIGTILTTELKKDFLKFTPDFTECTISVLPSILLNKRKGYAAEVFATYNQGRRTISLLKCQLEISLNGGKKEKVDFYFGGRYFSSDHKYLFNDPLSFVVQRFKQKYVSVVDKFFDASISFIRRRETIDTLTFIPLKPNDFKEGKFDRFAKLKLEKNLREEYKIDSILLCKKDFTQKGNNYSQRKENPKNAFEILSHKDVIGKNIIIIDDVFTTGATISEAIKTLYENGANKVIALILAVNQLTESFLDYQNLICPNCGSPMVIRMNGANGELFFGCKGYKQHLHQKYTLKVDKALSLLKNENRLLVTEVIDLDDEY